jgi:hypothetical protein
MLLLVVFIVGIVLATGAVPAYWNNSIANELNPASVGSTLLNQLGVVSSFGKWLEPLRMVGMAFLFSGITLALTVIISTLTMQSKMLSHFYQEASSR